MTVSYGSRKQVQAVLARCSYLSVNDRRLHFGSGEVDKVDTEIFWPNGDKQRVERVNANQLVTIQEGRGIRRTWRM